MNLKEIMFIGENEIVKKARLLATKAHKGQHRWGGEAYITHPEAVAKKVQQREGAHGSRYGYTIMEQVAAWLHDVVEDTDITLGALLDAGFDYGIVMVVDALTQREGEEYDVYIERAKSNAHARVMKIADVEHNLETFDHKKNKQRAMRYKIALRYLRGG